MEEPKFGLADEIIFEFEEFLELHEDKLPSGLDAQYMAYVPYLEKPFVNIIRLPKALIKLPMNAVLYQNWKTIGFLFAILLILGMPSFSLTIYTAALLGKSAVGITFVVLTILGLGASIAYLKQMYTILDNLLESKKAPWLVESIRKPFEDIYQKLWSRRLFTISMILAGIVDIILIGVYIGNSLVAPTQLILIILLIIIGFLGQTLMIFLAILSYWYIILNTGLYDKTLQPIIDRVKGYTEGQESILSKKNYEVVGVLSDTPGLSIRSLGDIPVLGLLSGIFLVNSVIFLLFGTFLLIGPLADSLANRAAGVIEANPDRISNPDPFGLNFILLAGIVLSALASFGAVLRPLIRITRVMGNFKQKALKDLDPFIFDEITGIALRRDSQMTDETQILFMLRNYIYTMKVSPVNPFRLIQIVLLAIVYGSRFLPIILSNIGS